MKKFLTIAAIAFSLVGCATAPAQKISVNLNSKFSQQEIAWSLGEGTSGIKGSALLMTQGGQPRTCAGKDVTLVPISAYSSERMSHIYGSVPGFRQIIGNNYSGITNASPVFNDTPAEFLSTTKKTKCDAQGYFEFENIPAGQYFVTTTIVWTTPFGNHGQSYNGGALVERITLTSNKLTKVTLSN